MPQRSAPTPDLEALAAAVAPLVVAILTRALSTNTAAPYTTRKGCGPAAVPDREWKRIAKRIGRLPYPGARWLVVERVAYDHWLAGQSGGSTTPTTPANDAVEPWSPARALASVGLRASGGRR